MIDLIGDLSSKLKIAVDPVVFQETMLSQEIPLLDAWQTVACRSTSPGLLLLCGRQTGKSTFAAVMALWKVMMQPNTLVLLISPTLRQSSELFRKTMVLFDLMKADPPPIKRTQTELWLPNGSKIFSLPGANPDAIRGYSNIDLVIEDEAAFVNDRTFTAYRPMLATNARGRHVLLTTPYGRRGHFYDLWTSDDPYFEKIAIQSKECLRIAPSFLDTEQRVLSSRAYRQEYECEFLEAANAVFPADLIERLTDKEERRTRMPDATEGTIPSDIQEGIDRITTKTEMYAEL